MIGKQCSKQFILTQSTSLSTVKNVVFDDCPPPINNSEKGLTMEERTILDQLGYGHYRLLQEQNQEGR